MTCPSYGKDRLTLSTRGKDVGNSMIYHKNNREKGSESRAGCAKTVDERDLLFHPSERPVLDSNPCVVSCTPFRLGQNVFQPQRRNFGLLIPTPSRGEQRRAYPKSTFPAPVALFIRPYQEKIILGIILRDRWVDKILAFREVIGSLSRIVILLVPRLQS